MNAAQVAGRRHARRIGTGRWQARCPVHRDYSKGPLAGRCCIATPNAPQGPF